MRAVGRAIARTPGDAAAALLAAAALSLWDASGGDLAVAHWFGAANGFAWRDAWTTSVLLHQGGRALAWLVMAVLVFSALRADGGPVFTGLAPARRWRAMAAVGACALLVPAIKQVSLSSCPWDLREFGGLAVHVSHWRWGVADGGPGRCFPSGHAVSAFAFLPVYFALRGERPAAARAWLAAIGLAGALFGLAQWMRGAHYVSHTLWSGWICWAAAAAWEGGWSRRRAPRAAVGAAPAPSDQAQRPQRGAHAHQGHRAQLLAQHRPDGEGQQAQAAHGAREFG